MPGEKRNKTINCVICLIFPGTMFGVIGSVRANIPGELNLKLRTP